MVEAPLPDCFGKPRAAHAEHERAISFYSGGALNVAGTIPGNVTVGGTETASSGSDVTGQP
jgi:hypothetical protein